MKRLLLLLLGFILISVINTKADTIDSLLVLVKKSKSDTEKVRLYSKLGFECEIEDILKYCNSGLLIIDSKKIQPSEPLYKFYQTEKARFYNDIGFYYYYKLNTLKSIDYYQRAIILLEQLQSDNDLLASLYNNVSSQYLILKNYRKPLYYLSKVIAIDKENKNEGMLALDYGNLASAYYYLNKRDSCIIYRDKSLKLRKKLDDKEGVITTLYNIGSNYYTWGDFTKSKKYFDEGFLRFSKLTSFQDSSLLINIFLWEGKLHTRKKEFKIAEEYFKKAYTTCFQTGKFTELVEVTGDLYRLYTTTGDSKKALIFYKKFKSIQDSSLNASIQQQAKLKEVKFDYDNKEIVLKAEQKRELNFEKEKQAEQKRLLLIALFVIALTILLLFVIYNRWKLVLKHKILIENQQRQLMKQGQLLQEANLTLDKKNQTITDSITAALNVQNALLPSELEIKELLGDESMALFMPKDLVSGDFYLVKHIGKYVYIVIADCTGHGVSGAFISVLSIKAIEKIISNTLPENLVEETLKQLHVEFLTSFGKSNESGFGIDLVVALYDTDAKTIKFSGSGNKFFIVSENELTIYPFKNLQIGKLNYSIPEIEVVELQLKKDDCVYASTDGYFDQVGEVSKKRFSSNRFKQLITTNATLTMDEQKISLEKTMAEWKGTKEQYDDITVLAWKV